MSHGVSPWLNDSRRPHSTMKVESARRGYFCPSLFNDFVSTARITVINCTDGLLVFVFRVGVLRYLFQGLAAVTAIQHLLEVAALKAVVLDIARFGAFFLLSAVIAILGHDILLSWISGRPGLPDG